MDSTAYKKRVDEFRHAQNKAVSTDLRNSCALAIDLTEKSVQILAQLLECGEAKAVEDKLLIDQRLNLESQQLEKIKGQLAEAQHKLDTKTDDQFTASDLRTLRFLLNTDASGYNTRVLAINSSIRLKIIPHLATELFDKIYSPDETSFKFEALADGINFVISLVPVYGHIYEGLRVINEIRTRRKKAFEISDRYNLYVEDYSYALKIWIEEAQSAIRTLQLID